MHIIEELNRNVKEFLKTKEIELEYEKQKEEEEETRLAIMLYSSFIDKARTASKAGYRSCTVQSNVETYNYQLYGVSKKLYNILIKYGFTVKIRNNDCSMVAYW